MVEPLFTTCDDWMRDVERFVAEPHAAAALRRHTLDPQTLLTVALAEAREADLRGYSTASHDCLAALAGVPRRTVATVRLALIDGGLQALTANPDRAGDPHRMLQKLPRTWALTWL